MKHEMASTLLAPSDIITERLDLSIVKKEQQENFEYPDVKIVYFCPIKKENIKHETIKEECCDLRVSKIKKEHSQNFGTNVHLASSYVKEEQPIIFETTIDSDIGDITLKILGENGMGRSVIISINMDGSKYFYEGNLKDIGNETIVLEKVCESEGTIKKEEQFITLNESNLSRIKRWLELGIYSCLESSAFEDCLSSIENEIPLDYSLPKPKPCEVIVEEEEEIPMMNDTPTHYRIRMPHIEVFEHEIEEMMKKTCNPKMARFYARRYMTPEEREKQDKNNLAARRSRAKEKIRDAKYTAFLNDPNRGEGYGDYKTVKNDKNKEVTSKSDKDKDETSNGDKVKNAPSNGDKVKDAISNGDKSKDAISKGGKLKDAISNGDKVKEAISNCDKTCRKKKKKQHKKK